MNIKYDVLGFPIFNGINIKFELKLDKKLLVESDKMQISECVKQLKEAINSGVIEKKIFNEKQLQQINSGEYRIYGLRWHHHQVSGKMQLVLVNGHDSVRYLGGKELWGGGIK